MDSARSIEHLKRRNFCSGTYAEMSIPSLRTQFEKKAYFPRFCRIKVKLSQKIVTFRAVGPSNFDLSRKIT